LSCPWVILKKKGKVEKNSIKTVFKNRVWKSNLYE